MDFRIEYLILRIDEGKQIYYDLFIYLFIYLLLYLTADSGLLRPI